MTEMIDITGLDKAAVLATLFNASAPAGMGFLQAGNGPKVMTIDDARQIIGNGDDPDYGGFHAGSLYYDYLFGRPLKLDLSGDTFNPWGFDRDNGGDGTAKLLIDALRTAEVVNDSTVNTDSHVETHKALLIERSSEAMSFANTQSTRTTEGGFVSYELGCDELGEVLEKAVDREIVRQGI